MSNKLEGLDEIVEGKLRELNELNFSEVGLRDVQTKVENIFSLIKQMDGVDNEDVARLAWKLECFKRRFNAYHTAQEQVGREWLMKKREYTGTRRNRRFIVGAKKGKLMVSEFYIGRVVMNWHFNQEGRMTLAKINKTSSPEDAREILGVDDVVAGYLTSDWTSIEMWRRNLPQWVEHLNLGFDMKTERKQYDLIMRYGHGTARDLIHFLIHKEIVDSWTLRRRQRQLTKIVDDSGALYILGMAGSLLPTVKSITDNSIEVSYKGSN